MYLQKFTSLKTIVLVIIMFTAINVSANDDGIWSRVDAASLRKSAAERTHTPDRFAAFSLNKDQLRQLLDNAPEEFTGESDLILSLPMPDGTLARFAVEHSLIVEPGLLKKFPELGATYRGQGIDDPTATVRFDLLPSGFHAIILSATGTVMLDPYSANKPDVYMSYFKSDVRKTDEFTCEVGDGGFSSISQVKSAKREEQFAHAAAPEVTSGTQLRTYRLAVAANWEYCQAVGAGTTSGCLAAQVVTMNRVNGVYERDVAIRMIMVANNNLIVFATDNTAACGGVACTTNNDGYSNGNGGTMLGQNQTKLDTVIGSGNYDIGHVFSTGGGGVAGLRVPCTTSKANGVTGQGSPVGDPFDIDYVAHEMGHQWGGNHTFNGASGSCSGGNRSAANSYEPGSGISIMAYAGICGAQDLARNSIDTFHVRSLEEIVAYSQTSTGNNCAVTTSTGNTPPTVTGPGNFTIPIQTPFSLTASATDANGDTLTYDWQQYNTGGGTGTTAVPNSDGDGVGRPIFRPYLPTTSATRYFPSLTYILNNANVPPSTYDCGRGTPFCLTGELMSNMARTMNFQVVVRDNRANGGGINTATSAVTVSTAAGPFSVTAPNTAVSFTGGSSQTVTWNVANSNLTPVNAANVDILLSTDGGLTFPTVLLAATPNDGNQAVTIPNIATTNARIMVRGSGNIFFDVSNTNFTITASSFTVSGRVFGLGDRGVRGATVTLTPQTGSPIVVFTNSFGQYSVANVPGGSYTITAAGRRFSYAPQTTSVNNTLTGIDFRPI
ncbi:MAG: reprolysin-like metallopeptidase [Pyrinomonadaceae bacterium]